MYNISEIGKRLEKVRKDCYKSYENYQIKKNLNDADENVLLTKHKNQDNFKYEKYACCKSIIKFSKEIGIERHKYGDYEKGKDIPSIEDFIKICNALDCSIEYFLGEGDVPGMDRSFKAHTYSGIGLDIIEHCLEDEDYLDCLNYFMKPENCSALFNKTTLMTWSNFWIEQNISNINKPLLDDLEHFFEEFYFKMPLEKHTPEEYKKFLSGKIPQNDVFFPFKGMRSSKERYNISKCIKINDYYALFVTQDKQENYDKLLNYLTEKTFNSFMLKVTNDIKKKKISEKFIELFEKYINDL